MPVWTIRYFAELGTIEIVAERYQGSTLIERYRATLATGDIWKLRGDGLREMAIREAMRRTIPSAPPRGVVLAVMALASSEIGE